MEGAASGLATIDWVIVAVYALSTIELGWFFSRKQQNFQEYFVGSGALNPFLVGVSLFATLLSTISYLSMPGETIAKGPFATAANICAYPIAYLFVSRLFLHLYMKQRVTSAYELLEEAGPGHSPVWLVHVHRHAPGVDVASRLHRSQNHDGHARRWG